MIINGILNPQINSLLSRVRHTNTLVISDRGFPFWPMIETVDISLVDDIPSVLQVLEAIKSNFVIGRFFMAEEFKQENTPEMMHLKNIDIAFLPMNLPYTMTPEMAAEAAKAFKPKILYPYHFGDTDTSRLVVLLKGEPGIEVRIRKMK